ncbi:coiled-coil domain-containing protein 102A-like [Hyperolius riggenbachi]|uniref:coiled-coil domain-containing protein 102A-like n=1 Tax=Hyperolius riggenbachi TaxID=752182 RepID=UPI0035A2D26B
MMKSYNKRPLISFNYHNAAPSKEKAKNPVIDQKKVDHLEEELRKGYHQEAVTLNAVMENMTRLYLKRFQELEKELRMAQLEVEQAEKQQWEAQRTQSELLQHNWELLRTLQHLRQTLETQQNRRHRRQQFPSEITHWKLVDLQRANHPV